MPNNRSIERQERKPGKAIEARRGAAAITAILMALNATTGVVNAGRVITL